LIIGGTGTISTAITRRLLADGADLTLYNRGNTLVPGAKVINGNRYDHSTFEAQMAEAGSFDCVIDMIAYHPGDVRSAIRAFAGRVAQYIFCSTVDVYVKAPQRYPIREDHPRGAVPEFQYAYQKVECELAHEEAAAGGAFALTILRPAATYQDTWTPIPLIGSGLAWLKRVRDGKPVIVLGDGSSFWTSSHRDDVGPVFAEAAGNPQTYGKAYNVTGDEWLT
jgi:nucleoside-diphosphate-sugar epimerase